MLYIDGSHGEGGGQILRTAVALSVLTKKPVEIDNIRANRPTSGIKPQHYVAMKSIEELCNGKSEGLEIGSFHLKFTPGGIKGGKYKFDIGTAGSISLVFQACLLSAIKTREPIIMRVTGGTDVRWSPSWDYFNNVFLKILQKMGISVETQLIKRGYYPKGGGEAILTINPSKEIMPLHFGKQQDFSEVAGILNIANLPDHIGTRMKHVAIKTLLKKNLKATIKIEETQSFSPGTGITLWAQSQDAVIGSTNLGEVGIPAEKIGEDAASQILQDMDAGATIDIHAFDQIIPYMVIAREKGPSLCIVREISSHAKTNMWLLKQFFDVEFKSENIGKAMAITIQ